MFTLNYYNLLANLTATRGSVSSIYGTERGLSIITTNNVCLKTEFGWYSGFPENISSTPTTGVHTAGISIGTGNTPPSLADVNLKNTITSGVSMSLTSTVRGVDPSGVPYIEHTVSITNTGSSEITIREIGLKQEYRPSSGGNTFAWLMDRTVLETPVVIQAGDAGVVKYRLQTTPVERTKNGVKLVPFAFGTDEEIAAMIDAANEGLIDLQTDGLWRVGDSRTIHIDAWTGGGSVSHSAQDLSIAIAQFGDYNECGCVMQFDFEALTTEAQRMNATNTNVGGYGATEMFTTSLPALVDALPAWLKSRLKTFAVLTSKGNSSSEIESVAGNKLALRSEVEVLNTHSISADGEGELIELYRYGGNRAKTYTGSSSNSYYWFRSPYKSGSQYFVSYSSNSASPTQASSTTQRIAPFGCL